VVRATARNACLESGGRVIFLGQANVQSSIYRFHFCQGGIYFFWELMDGLDVRPAICFASAFLSAAKDH